MRTGRILVIEDNQDNYQLVRLLLSQEGYQVAGAYDGENGLELARQLSPDLILLDLTLPGINGWTIATRLKTDPRTASIPVLALTGHTMPGDREKALQAGCDGYIAKPLDIPDFIETIQAALQARAG